MSLIPATIITGFLGSGKTTLLKRVLNEAHGQKIAVIENEFGEENIDSDILVTETQEQIIQMSNGCICCTIREDLRSTLQLLAAKRRKGLLDFERVVIETTGLADPGPVAQTFFMDDEVAETYLLDSIITLVDAKHAAQQLNDRQEARRQVGFADRIFISKSDLVSAEELDALTHRLKHMNPRAPQRAVHFGEVAPDLSDVGAAERPLAEKLLAIGAREAAALLRKQFEDVEPLVQRGRAIAIGVVFLVGFVGHGVHLASFRVLFHSIVPREITDPCCTAHRLTL